MPGNKNTYPLPQLSPEREHPLPPSASSSHSPSSPSISYHQHNYPYDYQLPASASQPSSSSPYSAAVPPHRLPLAFYDRDRTYPPDSYSEDDSPDRWRRDSASSYQTRPQSYGSPDAASDYLNHEHREYSRGRERDRPGTFLPSLHAANSNPYPMPSQYGGEDYSYSTQYPQQPYTSPYYASPDPMSIPRPNDYYPRTLPQPPGLPMVSPSAHVPTSHERGGGGGNTAPDSGGSTTASPNLPTGYAPYGRDLGNAGAPTSPSPSMRGGRYARPARPPHGIPHLPHGVLPSHDELQHQQQPLHLQSQPIVPSQLEEDLRSFGSPSSGGYEEYDQNIPGNIEGAGGETSAMGARGRGTSRRGGKARNDSGDGTPPAERKGGKKTENACYFCRRRKLKCDGGRPCNNCGRRGTECQYDEMVKRRGPGKKNKKSSNADPASPSKSRSGKRQQSSTSASEPPPVGGAPPEEMQVVTQAGGMPMQNQSLGAGHSNEYIMRGGSTARPPGMQMSTPPPQHHMSPAGYSPQYPTWPQSSGTQPSPHLQQRPRPLLLHHMEGGEGQDWVRDVPDNEQEASE